MIAIHGKKDIIAQIVNSDPRCSYIQFGISPEHHRRAAGYLCINLAILRLTGDSMIRMILGKAGFYQGYQYMNLLVVSLISKGKGVYISYTLSYCRFHRSQLTNAVDWTAQHSGWLYLILSSRKDGLLAADHLFNINNITK